MHGASLIKQVLDGLALRIGESQCASGGGPGFHGEG